jgi:hypothetical protein
MRLRTVVIGSLAAILLAGIFVPALTAQRGGGAAPPSTPVADQGLTDMALVGALDTHAHMAPDSPEPQVRGIDVLDYARMAKARGMRGFVIKQQYDQTAQLAYLARQAVPGIEVFGGIVMSRTVGGMSAEAVQHMARVTGGWGRIVWMPTLNAEGNTVGGANPPFVLVSKNGELLPETRAVLEVIAKTRTVDSNGELVLATGHMPSKEALLVLRAARDVGVTHMVVTHGATTWPIADLQEAVKLGAFVEARAGFDLISEPRPTADPRKLTTDVIRQLGPEHIVLASDLGQRTNPVHPDGLATAAKWLRSQGFTDRELTMMFKENPARLMGLPLQ